MKYTSIIITAAMAASIASAESVMKPINDKGFGTISGRVQSLTMNRSYENLGNGANSTMGIVLNYTSPEIDGFSGGLGYNYAGEIYDKNNSALLANDAINVMNELWGQYRFSSLDLTNTTVTIGRKINNAEVFRADDVRQKARSIQAVQAESTDVTNFRFAGGHAFKMSNWVQVRDMDDFQDFEDVFGENHNSLGVTWAEAVYTGQENVELAAFDAVAWNVAHLLGGRLKYDVSDETSILGYLRLERDIGDAAKRESEVIGVSVVQKVGSVKLEGGYFGVIGDSLRFQETTTGINHALGSSMMIYAGQFNGDAHTFYAKATTTLEGPETVLYALYNFSVQNGDFDISNNPITYDNAHELNLVVKQPIIDNLSAAFKYGLGYRETGTTAQDARLFVTYTF